LPAPEGSAYQVSNQVTVRVVCAWAMAYFDCSVGTSRSQSLMGEPVNANRNTLDLLRSDIAPARMLDAPVPDVMLDELSEPVLISHCRAALGRDKPTPAPIARTVSSGVDELASNSDWVMPPERLTPRELEVLGLLGRRYSNSEIADELVLSVRTVDRHVANIYAKTGVSTRRQAASHALAMGLLRTD
jgi:DNA-binding CsgD family transcriptional regulator